jgi:hypothetical protein
MKGLKKTLMTPIISQEMKIENVVAKTRTGMKNSRVWENLSKWAVRALL